MVSNFPRFRNNVSDIKKLSGSWFTNGGYMCAPFLSSSLHACRTYSEYIVCSSISYRSWSRDSRSRGTWGRDDKRKKQMELEHVFYLKLISLLSFGCILQVVLSLWLNIFLFGQLCLNDLMPPPIYLFIIQVP